jgi:hypothetical protein
LERNKKSMLLISDMEDMQVDPPKKTKYIYVSGHSYLRPSMNYLGPFYQTQFVNLVEPDTLCYDTNDALRSIDIFSGLGDGMRERVLQPFLRDLRFFSTHSDLRKDFVSEKPYLSDRVTDQMFSIRKQKGLVLGIWDLDEVREDPRLLKTPAIFGELLSDQPIQLSVSDIVNISSSRYPGHPLIIILSGCRITISPERAEQLRETEDHSEAHSRLALTYERRPDQITSGQLAEGLGLGLDIGAGKDDGSDKMEDDSDKREEEEARQNEALWDSLMYPPEPMEGIKGGYRRRRGSKKRNMGSKSKAKGKKPKRREKSKSKAKTAKAAKIMSKAKTKTKTKRKSRVKG